MTTAFQSRFYPASCTVFWRSRCSDEFNKRLFHKHDRHLGTYSAERGSYSCWEGISLDEFAVSGDLFLILRELGTLMELPHAPSLDYQSKALDWTVLGYRKGATQGRPACSQGSPFVDGALFAIPPTSPIQRNYNLALELSDFTHP